MDSEQRLEYAPTWDAVPVAQHDTAAFYTGHGLDVDTVHAMAMVATELIENAVKYGAFTGDDQVGVSLCAEAGTLSVQVTCPIPADNDEHLERLDRMIQWIRGYQDPFEAYVERLKVVSAQRLDSKESGLGLVRIAYEGRAVVDFFVDHDDRLLVSAHVEREE